MSKRKTTEQFKQEALIIHKNKYSYDLVQYINAHSKIKIKCLKHGVFEQNPIDHTKGQGCPKCANNIKQTFEDFFAKANIIHNDKYLYNDKNYVNRNTKIKIICKKHGEFSQTPYNHLHGHGCYHCGVDKNANRCRNSLDKFINEARKIHENLYEYIDAEYVNSHTKVKILCKKHGIFLQNSLTHITSKAGCPKCKTSRGEKAIIKFLDDNKVLYEYQKKFDDLRNPKTKRKLSFDFYLPEHNMCIEFDGKQHFIAVNYFHGEQGLKETRKRDNMRNEYCKIKNIQLLRIKYDENIECVLIKNILLKNCV